MRCETVNALVLALYVCAWVYRYVCVIGFQIPGDMARVCVSVCVSVWACVCVYAMCIQPPEREPTTEQTLQELAYLAPEVLTSTKESDYDKLV